MNGGFKYFVSFKKNVVVTVFAVIISTQISRDGADIELFLTVVP